MSPIEDYASLSASELHDEITGLDKEIQGCQTSLARTRKEMHSKMELREQLIDLVKTRSQRKGWNN